MKWMHEYGILIKGIHGAEEITASKPTHTEPPVDLQQYIPPRLHSDFGKQFSHPLKAKK